MGSRPGSTFAILYANANSLHDHTNGAAKSIRLLLEQLAEHGIDVHAVMGCTSDSEEGFRSNQLKWLSKDDVGTGSGGKIKRYIENRISYTLVATEHWSRRYLTSDEQQTIYRESLAIIGRISRASKVSALLSWGSLLLESALFREAQEQGLTTCFYLANPFYKKKSSSLLSTAQLIITDSHATRELYIGGTRGDIIVIPKCIERPSELVSPAMRFSYGNIVMVNPSINKGLEAFLRVAAYFESKLPRLRFITIDSRLRLDPDLRRLNMDLSSFSANMSAVAGHRSTDDLLREASIVLLLSIWHESGSRLIAECHARGIPILAFSTGGTPELLHYASSDIFAPPLTKSDSNGTLRIVQWDESGVCDRISTLMSRYEDYKAHSKALLAQAEGLYSNNHSAVKMLLTSLLRVGKATE